MEVIAVGWYNFCRKRESLKVRTPAIASGLAGEVGTSGSYL